MEEQKKTLSADGEISISRADRLPDWFPRWAHELGELYFSGTTSTFLVHGNTFDFVQTSSGQRPTYGTLGDFLAGQIFGRWDLVLHYDLARGLRCMSGSSSERLRDMVALANRRVGDLAQIGKNPSQVLAVLDRFVTRNVMAKPEDRVSVALIFDHASYLVPRGDKLSLGDATHLVTFLNWATSPYVKRLNMCTVLVEQELSAVSERLSGNPHVATLDVALPERGQRRRFLDVALGGSSTEEAEKRLAEFSDYGAEEIAELTAGISLADLNVLVQSAVEGGRRLDQSYFQELKKRLIERQAQGLLEFIEPSWGLDMVVGHDAAKKRLQDDAELIKRGELQSVPMGYLFCGPVGTGKSFLAQCAAGAIGIPVVKLKNFRSKYVGETEGNLERVLTVLRSMGPVAVVIDEADAMLGDRQTGGGDSGTSSRIFGMIAAQMGNTRYRGRILWMLLTARPDLLPIDLKRQGRAEVHMPLFYPTEQAELREMFVILARKAGAELRVENVPDEIPHRGNLSGADIEGLIGRAWRTAILAGEKEISRKALEDAMSGFMPSTQSLERELQEVAAIIECTDQEFLPQAKLEKMSSLGGRAKLQERLTALRQLVESM